MDHKRGVEGNKVELPEREPVQWPVIPDEYKVFDVYASSLLHQEFSSPAKATRSARKRALESGKSRRQKVEEARRKKLRRISCD